MIYNGTADLHIEQFTSQQIKELQKFGKVDLSDEQKQGICMINEAAQILMSAIYRFSPSSADQSAAIRYVRLAAMQANAAVVWDQPKGVE